MSAVTPTIAAVPVAEVRRRLIEGLEIALVDLREEGPYSRAHPLFAVSVPLSRLELKILDLVPRRDAPIVLYDDGEGFVARAAPILARLGYADVRRLEGGLSGWRAAGGEVFQDVNVPSKAFGELVEHVRHTPSLPAPEVKALIEAGADLVVLDARRFEEYRTMSIPTGTSVPGGELALRARDLAPNPGTTIVVNCAGRTRSIIGTQSLINNGVPNKVFALRNGTIGWTLAGFELDHGAGRRAGEPSEASQREARKSAEDLATRAGVRGVDRATVALWRAEPSPGFTLYLLDVRSPEEYAAGHLAGFRSAPGGQLVQATDEWVGVRHGRIVLADDDGVRASMTASWLRQLGWREVYVLEHIPLRSDRSERQEYAQDIESGAISDRPDDSIWSEGAPGGVGGEPLRTGADAPTLPPLPAASVAIAPAEFVARLARGGISVVDLATSRQFAEGHVPGARFALRSGLAAALAQLPAGDEVALVSPDGVLARLAAPEAEALTGRPALVLAGGTSAWRAEGRPLETGLGAPLSEPDDLYKRPYEGTDNATAAMQAYLDWEFGLVAQLERDGTHGFFVL